MAPTLQCPDCGTRHPVTELDDTVSFRCRGCGRVLKVPTQFRAPRPTPPATGSTSAAASSPTRRSPTASSPEDLRVPLWQRLLVWLVALPAGFLVVFLVARATGVLPTEDLVDLLTDTDWGRYGPIAKLLPFCALVTAVIVHFTVTALERRRRRRRGRKLAPAQPRVRDATRAAS